MINDLTDEGLFRTFTISTEPYGQGRWDGKSIKDLETCHLNNIVDMLKRRPRHQDEDIQLSREAKIKEILGEISSRQESGEMIIHSKHKFIFTEEMLIDYAKSLGVKLPKSKGAIYYVYRDKLGNERATRIPKNGIQLRFDTQKTIDKKTIDKKGKKK